MGRVRILRVPTSAGQFRKVKYTDGGCTMYGCMWCGNMIEIKGSPNWWNFCPICGKSWFNELRCRPNSTPRWVWDHCDGRWPPGYWMKAPSPTWRWVVECRTQWFGEGWSDWEYDFSRDMPPGVLGAWREAAQMLAFARGQTEGRGGDSIKYEYRIRKEKISV